jgi:hypothetical protein
MRGTSCILIILAVLALLATSPLCKGQILKGSISGTVVDPRAAVISGADIKATQTDTGGLFRSTSDASGFFRLNLIPVGTYDLEVTARGFKTSVTKNVAVTAGVDNGLGPITLTIGESAVTVEVTESAALIESTQSQVTTAFSGPTLRTFAGIQEHLGIDNVAMFVPGITSTRDATFAKVNGIGISANGLRSRNNDQQIDGQNNNDNTAGGASLPINGPEFLEQYVVVTNHFGAEYGRNSGSLINLITKSGTNRWHGSLFENENNSVLNSLTNFEKRFQRLTKPPRFNDQYGGFTLGGPGIKNKLFFFGGFTERNISAKGVFNSGGLTPTPAGLAKLNTCFPNSTSLQVFNKFGPYSISSGAPHPSGNPVLLPIRSGSVNCTDVPFAPVERTLSIPLHGIDWMARGDLQLRKDHVTWRYLYDLTNTFNRDSGDAANGYPFDASLVTRAILVSWTRTLSSRMVNEARISFNRFHAELGGNEANTLPKAANLQTALALATIQAPGFARLFGAANALPTFPLPFSRVVNTWQAQDNWNYLVRRHQLKAGLSSTYQRSINNLLPNINGSFQFANWGDVSVPNTPGCPSANPAFCTQGFVSNTPNQVRIASGTSNLDFREYDTFIYAGDDWNVARNLTFNLGLTWSYFGQPKNLLNQISTQRESDPSTAFWATVNRFNGDPIPLSVRTDPLVPAIHNTFGPSIGFAYSPAWGGILTGHGKTVLRGGYRLLYDPPFYQIFLDVSAAAPMVFLQSFTGAAAFNKGLNGLKPSGDNVRNQLATFLQKGFFDPRELPQTKVASDFRPDKVHMWSFGIQRQISRGLAFEARYAGNHASRLFQSVNGNPFIADLKVAFPAFVPAGLTPCPAARAVVPSAVGRVNCDEGIVKTITNGAYSNYHGLQMELRAINLFNQLALRTGYTFSKTLDNASEVASTFAGGNTNAFAQNPLNTTKAEYSFSGLDIPHAWTIVFTEELPFFKQQRGLIGHLFGGWIISGNYVLTSGQRYTPSQRFSGFRTAKGNYYDLDFIGSFVGMDVARPFLGNLHAPQTSVGIFGGDACKIFAVTGAETVCQISPSQLVLLNSLNLNLNSQPVAITRDQVRFIINATTAQTIFGTPFGDTPRNVAADAWRNLANFSLLKRVKITDRTALELRATFLNSFNHPNFVSVDPFVEDAGLARQGTGFGDPTVSNSSRPFVAFGGTRVIMVGATLRF